MCKNKCKKKTKEKKTLSQKQESISWSFDVKTYNAGMWGVSLQNQNAPETYHFRFRKH